MCVCTKIIHAHEGSMAKRIQLLGQGGMKILIYAVFTMSKYGGKLFYIPVFTINKLERKRYCYPIAPFYH